MGANRALLVGCIYPGSKYQLKGCANDAYAVQKMLLTHYGFTPSDITMMLDCDPSLEMPTGAAIKRKLSELVAASQPGDSLVFHYSGHGTQIPSTSPEEADRKDECLCPADMNVITDDDLRRILKDLAEGVTFTMIADCCHSGTLLDHATVQITGPKASDPGMPPQLLDLFTAMVGADFGMREVTNRAIPSESYVQMLGERLGVPIKAEQVRLVLAKVFGSEASLKFQGLLQKVGDAVASLKVEDVTAGFELVELGGPEAVAVEERGFGSLFKDMAAGMAQAALAEAQKNPDFQRARERLQQVVTIAQSAGFDIPVILPAGEKPPSAELLPPDVGILISGCQANETSADAHPPGQPDKAYGALTNALTNAVNEFKRAHPDANISYRTLVSAVRDSLGAARFPQNPCLESSAENADRPFVVA
ncbi:MAG: metacaspase type II [Monoraphidium minutum]|nr:MAG: metacaspase type II [Monoraphidium minutum]